MSFILFDFTRCFRYGNAHRWRGTSGTSHCESEQATPALAAAYSPTTSPPQYHLRSRALLPGSVCLRVYPRGSSHQHSTRLLALLRIYNTPAYPTRAPHKSPTPRTIRTESPRPLVRVSFTRRRACTPRLSNWSSPSGLTWSSPMGNLVLRPASHLDAFSGYPIRRSLLSHAAGATTEPRALRPPRSSRTRGSPSQIPNARSG